MPLFATRDSQAEQNRSGTLPARGVEANCRSPDQSHSGTASLEISRVHSADLKCPSAKIRGHLLFVLREKILNTTLPVAIIDPFPAPVLAVYPEANQCRYQHVPADLHQQSHEIIPRHRSISRHHYNSSHRLFTLPQVTKRLNGPQRTLTERRSSTELISNCGCAKC